MEILSPIRFLLINDPKITFFGSGNFLIQYLGWSIKIFIDRIGRIKIQNIHHKIGYFKISNQYNANYCDTQDLTFIRIKYGIVWMDKNPKLDIGISETGSYTRIIFRNKVPEITNNLNVTRSQEL